MSCDKGSAKAFGGESRAHRVEGVRREGDREELQGY